MLKLNLNPTFSHDVEITVPGQDETGTIPLTFRYRSKSELTEFYEDSKGKPDDHFLFEMIENWGLAEEYTRENLATLLDNYPASATEIAAAYNDLLIKSRIKN